MKRYIVYLDVLGYSALLKKDQSKALKKIQKFYDLVAANAGKPDKNILLSYSNCAQLVFETLEESLLSTGKIFKSCHQYNRKCRDDFDSMIFLSGGISIDEHFPSKHIPVRALLNIASYANRALADAYSLSVERRGAVLFVSEEVFKEYHGDEKLRNAFYCYERLKKDGKVQGDFGWMYDKDLNYIGEVIKLAQKICKKYRPPTPPPFDHPELNSAIRIYQQYEETLKLSLRCLGRYIKDCRSTNNEKAEEATKILGEFLDYEFLDTSMHPYNWGIWLIAFQAYFRSVGLSNELSTDDKKLLKDKFLRINHSNKMDDFCQEWALLHE